MKVYVDSESKIRDVGSTTDTTLTELTINNEGNPFEGWSKAKICCYMVTVVDGVVTMMTPYVDTRNFEMVDNLDRQITETKPYTATQSASCGDTEVIFEDVPQGLIICEVTDSEGNEIFYNLERSGDTVTVDFEPLEYAADVTISIQ